LAFIVLCAEVFMEDILTQSMLRIRGKNVTNFSQGFVQFHDKNANFPVFF